MIQLTDCQTRDTHDPLHPLRELFSIPEGIIYLDGNSLGVMPRTAPARVAEVVTHEWGHELIRAWNSADWFGLPQRLGNKIARLIGAGADEVVVTDSTSINLFKVLAAALDIAAEDAPTRKLIVSERGNFPTDLYIAESLARERGLELKLIEAEELECALTDEVAVLLLTHVDYRTGAMHDMATITARAHAAGILTVWDLAHSAGAVPVDLNAADADFAIGCSYKYLNGGPGSPAFAWVNTRLVERFRQPLAGWWGHAKPFEFTPAYRPAQGIARYLCGTQPIISMSALECGLDIFVHAEALGGIQALRSKSLALTDLFIELVEARCGDFGLELVTPRDPHRRGSQVSFTRASGVGADALDSGAFAIVQALIARGVIGDFRAGDGGIGARGDILRFGFTPLYIGFADVWNAVEQLRQVFASDEWRQPRFNSRSAVT